MGVTAQGRCGEETHRHLEVIGQEFASHHRDPPSEFLQVLGAGKESRESGASGEAESLEGGARKQERETT